MSMSVTLLKSKIHRATVTDANLEYEGSVSICPKLIEAAKLLIHEQIDVYNCNNGERFTTYVIKGKEGEICLNGAAARKVQKGDLVILATYASMPDTEAFEFKPSVVMVTSRNEVKNLHRP